MYRSMIVYLKSVLTTNELEILERDHAILLKKSTS